MAFSHTAVGVFQNRDRARDAILALKHAGFTVDNIGLIARDGTDDELEFDVPDNPPQTHWEEGTGIGAVAGATTGLGLGFAVAAGLIPAIGPVIAGGSLMALIASAGAGATVGTVVGGLIGLGIPEEEAAYYDEELRTGRTLVTVEAGDRHAEAMAIMHHYGAVERQQTRT